MPQAVASAAVQFVIGHFSGEYAEFKQGHGKKAWLRRLRNRQKVDVEYTGGIQPRRRLYGYFRCAGLNVMPAMVTGPTGTRLHKCLAISDGEINSFTAVNYNNVRMPIADFAGGPITVGVYTGTSQIHLHKGLASQSADSAALAAPGWTTEHRGDGIAYSYHFFDQSPSVFGSGVPVITFEGLGCKVYDPRDDASPGADPTDTAFHSFSTNPVLQLVDFLVWTSGANELGANIDWDDVVTVANICDEDVTIPLTVGPGTTTQKRYTSSIEAYSPLTIQERDSTIATFAKAFMGVCWFSGGKWRFRAGAYTSSVGSITDRDFLGDFKLSTAQPRAGGGIMNTIRGTYVEQAESTQPKGFPEVSASAYVTEDGEVVHGEVEYPTARTAFEAQRNAIQHLRLSRRRLIVSANFRFRARNFMLFDILLVTCTKAGWTSQPCRIIRHRENQDFTVSMSLQEVDSTDYSDPDPADYLFSDDITVPVSANYQPNAPRNVRATSLASAILLEWDSPLLAPVGVLYQVYEHSSSTPFSSAVAIGPETAQNSLVIPRTTAGVLYYWVTAKDPATQTVSTQSPPTNGVPAAPASASTSLGAVVTPGSATASVSGATATTNTVTVTPTGGTAPYTYAWTFTAGGTGITTDASTSAATTFSSTGLAEDEERTGTARCRVTDNVGATYDVFVAVTIYRQFTITLTNQTVASLAGSISAAVSSIVIASGGEVSGNSSSAGNTTYYWLPSGATASNYDARITLNTGTLQSGNVGTWVHMSGSSSVVAVGVRTPGEGAGTSSQNLTLEIRDHTTLSVLATATVILSEQIA